MTPLFDHLRETINMSGPMPFADYMQLALMHPEHGYYQTQAAFGEKGDFVTAPEISQMFGEMIGLWLLDRWIALGRPASLSLVELGPGRGTLMKDILRSTQQDPKFTKAVRIYFLEAGSRRRAEQGTAVAQAVSIETLDALPPAATLFVSNEFFDALPVHQYVFQQGDWWERAVGLSADGKSLQDGLLPRGEGFSSLQRMPGTPKENDRLEHCPAAISYAHTIADHIKRHRGAALMIDYGYNKTAFGNSLQAVQNHTFASLLDMPGEADITAHVNFETLNDAAQSANISVFGAVEQGAFLMSLGLGMRAQQLAKTASDSGKAQILEDLKRLTAPDQMGSLFKAVAWQSPDLSLPPGF